MTPLSGSTISSVLCLESCEIASGLEGGAGLLRKPQVDHDRTCRGVLGIHEFNEIRAAGEPRFEVVVLELLFPVRRRHHRRQRILPEFYLRGANALRTEN